MPYANVKGETKSLVDNERLTVGKTLEEVDHQWKNGQEAFVASTHSRRKMVGPSVPEIVHPWNGAGRSRPDVAAEEWHSLVCDFEDPEPPVCLNITPAAIARTAAKEIGAPELAPNIKIKLQRVDAWRYADGKVATVEMEVYPLPGYLHRSCDLVCMDSYVAAIKLLRHGGPDWPPGVAAHGHNCKVASIRRRGKTESGSARCSYIMPGDYADHELGPWSDVTAISIIGNTKQKQVVRFHILWAHRVLDHTAPTTM